MPVSSLNTWKLQEEAKRARISHEFLWQFGVKVHLHGYMHLEIYTPDPYAALEEPIEEAQSEPLQRGKAL